MSKKNFFMVFAILAASFQLSAPARGADIISPGGPYNPGAITVSTANITDTQIILPDGTILTENSNLDYAEAQTEKLIRFLEKVNRRGNSVRVVVTDDKWLSFLEISTHEPEKLQ